MGGSACGPGGFAERASVCNIFKNQKDKMNVIQRGYHSSSYQFSRKIHSLYACVWGGAMKARALQIPESQCGLPEVG